MAIIKKCSLCENKGFLLKLKNNLCSSCDERLKRTENTYNNVLQEISKDPAHKDTYIYTLFSIMGDIENLSNFSTIINKDLALKLINSLNLSQQLENTSTTNSNPPSNSTPALEIDNAIKNMDNLINSVSPITNINAESIDTSANDIYEAPYAEEVSYKSIEENIAQLENPVVEINTPIQPILNQSDKIVIETLYNNTAELMKKLDASDIDTNELAKGFFTLKNSFKPTLKTYNLLEVNDVNIDNYINLLEKKLCHRTNTIPEKLYTFFNYVVISIQTTGIKTNLSDIIEISALKISYDNIVDEFYSLVNPLKSIKLIIEERTGISSDMVSNEPSLDQILPKFNDFLGNSTIVSFNSNYTLGFISHFNKQLFDINLVNEDECILKLYRSRYKSFYGYPPRFSDLSTITIDILSNDDANSANDLHSIAKSSSLAIYKLYEILKYRYK